MHSDRIDQSHNNQIDWKVAALDGLGLILFFVPGVVAFAVDFYTGAIYLPPGSKGDYAKSDPVSDDPATEISHQSPVGSQPVTNASYPLSQPAVERQQLPPGRDFGAIDLERLEVPREELEIERIEQVVTSHVGRPVSLETPTVRVSRLMRLDRFAHQCHRHRQDSAFGHKLRAFLDGFQRA